jgi:RNA polymerase sigma-70 factor (ECF subfamily)
MAIGMSHTGSQVFPSTHWSVVLSATDETSPQARDSLEKLCRTYWYPMYAFVRHRGHSPQDSEDLVQGFFAHLLDKSVLTHVDREKGRFRSFLLACLCNYLNNERTRAQTQRRGAGCVHLPLDTSIAESRYADEVSVPLTPEQLFDRTWALGVLQRTLESLRSQFGAAGREDLFDAVEGHLTGSKPCSTYGELGARWGMNEPALRMMVTRLRRRYGELVRLEISQTLASADDVEEELQHLLAVFGR